MRCTAVSRRHQQGLCNLPSFFTTAGAGFTSGTTQSGGQRGRGRGRSNSSSSAAPRRAGAGTELADGVPELPARRAVLALHAAPRQVSGAPGLAARQARLTVLMQGMLLFCFCIFLWSNNTCAHKEEKERKRERRERERGRDASRAPRFCEG